MKAEILKEAIEKLVKPSQRREMEQPIVSGKAVSIRLACLVFSIREICYRYQAKLSHQNAEIADQLIRLTHNHRNQGFGLCFLYLCNVKGFCWSHERVYRIYRELELNLRMKPRKRLVREKSQPLAVPETMNVIDDFNRKTLGIEVDLSLSAERATQVLDQTIEWHGKPL